MTPSHAFVCYDRRGTPILLAIEDGSLDTARRVGQVVCAGGRVERMPIEEAKKVKLHERPR